MVRNAKKEVIRVLVSVFRVMVQNGQTTTRLIRLPVERIEAPPCQMREFSRRNVLQYDRQTLAA